MPMQMCSRVPFSFFYFWKQHFCGQMSPKMAQKDCNTHQLHTFTAYSFFKTKLYKSLYEILTVWIFTFISPLVRSLWDDKFSFLDISLTAYIFKNKKYLKIFCKSKMNWTHTTVFFFLKIYLITPLWQNDFGLKTLKKSHYTQYFYF